MTDECEHGSLRRSCEICERDAEIESLRAEIEAGEKLRAFAHECNMKQRDSLRAELAEKDKRIEELEKAFDEDVDLDPDYLAVIRGHHIVTDEQIDKAWARSTEFVEEFGEYTLKEALEECFHIVGCEGCGGWKVVSKRTLDSEGE